ncbi:hypothetical protein ABT186_46495, partial [Streptomyces sp. NPDC001634]
GSGAGTGGASPGTGKGSGGAGGASGGATIDPDTGQVVGANGGSAGGTGADAFAVPVSTSRSISSGSRTALMAVAGVLLLAVTVGPPLLTRRLKRGRS